MTKPFKKGDKVRVSAAVMGVGISPIGVVTDVEKFMGEDIISVDFIEPSIVDNRRGCTVINPGMLKRIKSA